MKILVTGGCGFIGSHFIRRVLARQAAARVLNLDKMTYAGRGRNLADLPSADARRHRLVRGDIADRAKVRRLLRRFKPDAIVNFAAETHVDRSIVDASDFLRTNVSGTQVLLEAAREFEVPKFLQVSTDEVYGTLGVKGKFREDDSLEPNSPYSASKASADLFCRAAHETYGQHVTISRCCNNYGPFQFPEKLIPLMVVRALENRKLPVYGDGLQVRDWIYVVDHADAIWRILKRGCAGEIYNVGSTEEHPNLWIVKRILKMLGRPESLIEHVPDRLGHDRRYAVDSAKLRRELGWRPGHSFGDALAETVRWYMENPAWWRRLQRLRDHRQFQDRYYRKKERRRV